MEAIVRRNEIILLSFLNVFIICRLFLDVTQMLCFYWFLANK